jgi:hypothetical protein
MAVDMILNELSLPFASDIPTARTRFSAFIQVVRSVRKQGFKKAALRTQYDFLQVLLAPDYPLRRWLNDSEVDHDEKTFLKTIATSSPYSQDIANALIGEVENNTAPLEFRHQGEIAIGLGIAFILDNISISFPSDERWNTSVITLDVTYADGDDEQVSIIHASAGEHVQAHTDWFQQKKFSNIQAGQDLWIQRDALFPNLQFCQSVQESLENIMIGDVMLSSIRKRLEELQDYSLNWTDGGFDQDNLPCKATTESEATLKKYGKERTFLCPDGETRIFSWHVRLTPHAWRIYFYPGQPKKMMIGYIGPHLPTIKYK